MSQGKATPGRQMEECVVLGAVFDFDQTHRVKVSRVVCAIVE